MIKEILIAGWRIVLKNIKFIFLLWGTNITLSLILTIPVYSILLDNLQNSIWSDSLALSFNYFWLLQFEQINENLLDKIPILFLSIVVLNLLLQKFYQGGLITVFNNSKKNHISDFFYGGVKYWYRFVKVSMIYAIFLILVFIFDNLLVGWIELLYKDTNSVFIDLIFRSIRYVSLIFLIGVLTMISDYTHVYLALRNELKIRIGIFYTLKFIRKRLFLVFTVFLIIAIIGVIGAIVYNVVAILVPRSPFYFLILTFILQQMLIIFRLSITMLFYSTEVYLFKDQDAEIISE